MVTNPFIKLAPTRTDVSPLLQDIQYSTSKVYTIKVNQSQTLSPKYCATERLHFFPKIANLK